MTYIVVLSIVLMALDTRSEVIPRSSCKKLSDSASTTVIWRTKDIHLLHHQMNPTKRSQLMKVMLYLNTVHLLRCYQEDFVEQSRVLSFNFETLMCDSGVML